MEFIKVCFFYSIAGLIIFLKILMGLSIIFIPLLIGLVDNFYWFEDPLDQAHEAVYW